MKNEIKAKKTKAPGGNRVGRPQGLMIPGLKEWAETWIKGSRNKVIAEALFQVSSDGKGCDESSVSKAFNGKNGIAKPDEWSKAIRLLVDKAEISREAEKEFNNLVQQARAGVQVPGDGLQDHFHPIRNHLIADFESGVEDELALSTAFKKARGLLRALKIQELKELVTIDELEATISIFKQWVEEAEFDAKYRESLTSLMRYNTEDGTCQPQGDCLKFLNYFAYWLKDKVPDGWVMELRSEIEGEPKVQHLAFYRLRRKDQA